MTAPTSRDHGHPGRGRSCPLIISVDDHVLEPRTSGRRSCPPSLRDRGPEGRPREGQARLRGRPLRLRAATSPTAQWCDLWLFDDLVLPTGLLHAAGRRPAATSSATSRPIYEDFRPGTYDQTARLADMDANHVEVGDQLPEHLPALRRAGLRRAGRQGPRARVPADLQRLDDRRVVRRRRPAVGSSRSRSCRCGTRSSRPTRCGAARRRAATRSPSARTRRSSASRRSTPASGTCCGTRATRPTRRCRCTSARRRRCRPPSPTRRSPPRCRSTRRTPQGSLCDWVFSGTLSALPRRSRSPTPRARSAGCRSCSSAWTACWRGRRRRRATSTDRAERARARAGCAAASSTTCTACKQPRRRRARAHPVRDRLPALRRHVARTPARSPTTCSPPPAWTPRSATQFLRGNAIRGLRARPLRHHRVTVTAARAGADASSRARPARRRAARRDRPPQPGGRPACSRTSPARPGSRFADYLVLGVVRRSPGQRSAPTAIGDVLGRTTGGMSLTLDRLEAAGLVRRTPTPTTAAGSWSS